jgi:hypothetical protein
MGGKYRKFYKIINIMGLRETKIGKTIIVAQTTYYVYSSKEKRDIDEYYLCTSSAKKIRDVKKQLKEQQEKNT